MRFLTQLCIIGFAAAGQGADWPQFLGPDRNGVSPEAVSTNWGKESPKVIWQRRVGQGFSAPVVKGNKVIIFHRVQGKELTECLDAATGKEIWRSEYPATYQDDFGMEEGPRATPGMTDNFVYTYGPNGMLQCLELESGKQRWSVDTRKAFGAGKGFFGIACSPLVEGDSVLLNVGGKDGAGIVAFNKTNGTVRWKASNDEASYSSPVASNIGGKRYGFVLTRKFLTALDPGTGKIFFEFPWQPEIDASVSAATPLVMGDVLFISASYGAGAAALRFKETGPEVVWSGDDILSNHYATSVGHDGYLYGFDGRQEQGCNLRCVELKTGKIRWSQDRFGAGTVTRARELLLVLTEKGELIVAPATPSGFHPFARAQILPFGVRAYPALAGGRFYARSKDKLVCLELKP